MDKVNIEKYKRQLEIIEKHMSDEMIKNLSKKQIEEYIILVSKIKARLDILENS